MTSWLDLAEQHDQMRSVRAFVASDVRKRLIQLSELGYCDASIQGRFTYKKVGRNREHFISPRDDLPVGTEQLRSLPNLKDGLLSFMALTTDRMTKLIKLTIQVKGETEDGLEWTVAVHLDEEPQGEGACSHALFHCHVGTTLDAKPKVRVPLAAVGPVAMLDWVISTVVPDWEPEPWK